MRTTYTHATPHFTDLQNVPGDVESVTFTWTLADGTTTAAQVYRNKGATGFAALRREPAISVRATGFDPKNPDAHLHAICEYA